MANIMIVSDSAPKNTYDDGDNMLTKIEPWNDDFNDEDKTGWTVVTGTWVATDGYLKNTAGGHIKKGNTDANLALWFSYRRTSASSDSAGAQMNVRWRDNANNDRVRLNMKKTSIVLDEKVSGAWTTLDTFGTGLTNDVWYEFYVEADGANVTVLMGERGAQMQEILSTASASVTAADQLYFLSESGSATCYSNVDNVRMVTDSLSSTTTFAYNDSNELTSMTFEGDTTTFAYDAWGRQISKYMGSQDTDYTYAYGGKLTEFSSTFHDEGDVEYDYRGDEMRHKRTSTSEEQFFNWTDKWDLVSSEAANGTLLRSHIQRMAHAEVEDLEPSIYSYYVSDIIGSVRYLYDDWKNEIGSFEYGAFGSEYSESTNKSFSPRFAMHTLDSSATHYYAPYRYYSPGTSRWLTRDPMTMIDGPNMYTYVLNNPLDRVDPLGLFVFPLAPVLAGIAVLGISLGNLLFDWDNPDGPRARHNCNHPCTKPFVACVDAGIPSRICTACFRRCQGQNNVWPKSVPWSDGRNRSCGPGA